MTHKPRHRIGRRRHLVLAGVLVFLLAAGGVIAAANLDWIKSQYLKFITLDFEGPGAGEVVVRINEGDDGETITQRLVDLGVVRDYDSFYRLLLQANPIFHPGSYQLKLKMSNQAALDAITNPANVLTFKITIPEGYRAVQIFEEINRITGIPIKELRSTASDLTKFGIDSEAPTIEGYLFPATYSFDPQVTALDILGTMVQRMKQELDFYSVAASDRLRILTLASIIQREARHPEDFYKVSRVFYNRLEKDMLLQTDPTISYSYDGTDMTDAPREKAIEYGYNTYLVKGLPPGPISSPGSLAIDAALNPVPGSWLYFVTINLQTGETKFSKTLAQHEEYVKLLRAWEEQNPGWYDD